MKIVTIHAAKTHLSQLLAEVEAGEEIVFARGKTPIAKLTRYVAAAAGDASRHRSRAKSRSGLNSSSPCPRKN